MAITQHRLQAIVNVAKDYKQALDRVRESIERKVEAAKNGGDPMLLLQDLEAAHCGDFVINMLLKDYRSPAILDAEERYLARNFKFNERRAKAQKARRVRRQGGVLPTAAMSQKEREYLELANEMLASEQLDKEQYGKLVVNGRYVGPGLEEEASTSTHTSEPEPPGEERLRRMREADDAEWERQRASLHAGRTIKADAAPVDASDEPQRTNGDGVPGCDNPPHP